MVGFAVIGLGMGKNRSRLIDETDGAELKVVCDVQQDLAKSFGTQMETDWTADMDAAFERDDVDVVLVMTPSGQHAEVGIRAAKAGKHVITTKPMDVSTDACDRLIALTAVLKRMIESAPTRLKARAILLPMIIITTLVAIAITIIVIRNDCE